jgi:flavin reductase (DIM6/NTAB) family NADH-FMN oxidoreductase RutF
MSADGNTIWRLIPITTSWRCRPSSIVFAPNSRQDTGEPKDTLKNVREILVFVVNIVGSDQRKTMNLTPGLFDYGVSEFESLGIASIPLVSVRPPRVAGSPAALECRAWNSITLPRCDSGQSHVVIGE